MRAKIFEELPSISEYEKANWFEELKNNITSVEELSKYISLTEIELRNIHEATNIHPINITRYYLSLINNYNKEDPLKKMSIPAKGEIIIDELSQWTTQDPYGDDNWNKGNGVLHKYPYSALILVTEYCAMYCRHCFRKRLVGLPNDIVTQNIKKAVRYIREHKEIKNVILSGGDPMLLPTAVIKDILEQFREIDHVNYIRIGTRAPVVHPIRFFDDELMEYLEDFNKVKTLYIPTQFNHVNEITPLSSKAVFKIRSVGITVNNQAVLLNGVNDNKESIVKLMDSLVKIGINPYYLYQCMPVSRVRSHFQVPLNTGIDIVDKAKRELDGYGKRFKYIMGHKIGKIEICGKIGNHIIMNQIHSTTEHPGDGSRIIIGESNPDAGWFDDLQIVDL